MTKQIETLKQILGEKKSNGASDLTEELLLFRSEHNLFIPPDLAEYFKLQHNARNTLEKDMTEFYKFDEFKSVKKELAHWCGIPDYGNIVNTLSECENCFVFADHSAHLFAYAIRLYQNRTEVNEAYLICGDKYKVVANSFSEFLDLYFNDSIELITI